MRVIELIEKKKEADKGSGHKLQRDAFLYLSPKEPRDEFAQCSSCRLYLPGKERCALFGPSTHVPAEASCGLYIHGEPSDDQECESVVKPKEAGLVRREVRCENCVSFAKGRCRLYEKLNAMMSDKFDLNPDVDPQGCCNAQEPK